MFDDLEVLCWEQVHWKILHDWCTRTSTTILGASNMKLAFLVDKDGDCASKEALMKIFQTYKKCLAELKLIGRTKKSFEKLDTASQDYCIQTLHNTYLCMWLCYDFWKPRQFCLIKYSDWARTHLKEVEVLSTCIFSIAFS